MIEKEEEEVLMAKLNVYKTFSSSQCQNVFCKHCLHLSNCGSPFFFRVFGAYAIEFNEHPGSEVLQETGKVYAVHFSKGINICNISKKNRRPFKFTTVLLLFLYGATAIILSLMGAECNKIQLSHTNSQTFEALSLKCHIYSQ